MSKNVCSEAVWVEITGFLNEYFDQSTFLSYRSGLTGKQSNLWNLQGNRNIDSFTGDKTIRSSINPHNAFISGPTCLASAIIHQVHFTAQLDRTGSSVTPYSLTLNKKMARPLQFRTSTAQNYIT
jgi:hypothetical protein